MASVKAQLNPAITAKGWPGFLLWARKERPAQYAALLAQVPIVQDFENTLKGAGLGDWTDIFSSIGSGLSSAGSTIASVFTSIAPAAIQYELTATQANAAQKLTNTQLALAVAQHPPAQTATVAGANGTTSVPVVRNAAGQMVPATVNAAGQLVPISGGGGIMATLAAVPMTTWLIGAGALAGILLLLKRR
jgi:hypothetical protein